MFVAAVENFILFSMLLSVVSFALACAVRRVVARGGFEPHPHLLSRLYAAAVVIPPAASAWLVSAALLPESWLGEAAFKASHPAPLHELHLLGDLTAALEPALSYFTISFVTAAALFAAGSSVRGCLRIGGVVERLEVNALPPPPEQLTLVERTAARCGLKVGLVMSDYPFSFVWGFYRSKLILSSGLLRVLTPEELTGVLEHEAAHHARRDNLIKLSLALCGYASPAFPLSRLVLRWRTEQIEMVCDEVAVAYTETPLEIAGALVKLRRQTLVNSGFSQAFSSGFIPEDTHSFERRVRRIVSLADSLPTPEEVSTLSRLRRGEAALVLLIFAGTLSVISLLSPLAVHEAAESLIQLIK
ncbi:MAG TPA: M56 family metallopeptidase [Blastocatellia bacterium]|nr:M56 family metallopeptidase [Blastocatellia bacterium]